MHWILRSPLLNGVNESAVLSIMFASNRFVFSFQKKLTILRSDQTFLDYLTKWQIPVGSIVWKAPPATIPVKLVLILTGRLIRSSGENTAFDALRPDMTPLWIYLGDYLLCPLCAAEFTVHCTINFASLYNNLLVGSVILTYRNLPRIC